MAKQLPYTRKEAKAWAKKTVVDWYECPTTPITSEYTLDEEGIRENIETYVEIKENGLVVGGFTAECWNMTLSDWFRYHEIVADANRGRLPMWSIILDPSVHQVLEKMEFLEKLGFSGTEVMNPSVQLRSDEEIYDYFKYITDHSDLAIFLYRTPVSGKLMSLELMARLAELDTVTGVKMGDVLEDSCISLRKMVPSDFIVSNTNEYWYLHELFNGGQVVFGGIANLFYGKKREILHQYTKLARKGNLEEAYPLWKSLEPVRDLLNELFIGPLSRTGSYAAAIGNLKAWAEAMGLKAGPMLPPVRNISLEKQKSR